MSLRIVVQSILAALLLPGVVTVFVPYFILGPSLSLEFGAFSLLRMLALAVGAMGGLMLLYCIWGFAIYGQGTLAPINPPKILVVRGLYRHTRNPMYMAVLCILVAETLFFQHQGLIIYAMIVFGMFQLFILTYEEPHLRRQFGQQYLDYCQVVPRWGFTFQSLKNFGGKTS